MIATQCPESATTADGRLVCPGSPVWGLLNRTTVGRAVVVALVRDTPLDTHARWVIANPDGLGAGLVQWELRDVFGTDPAARSAVRAAYRHKAAAARVEADEAADCLRAVAGPAEGGAP